MRLWIGKCLVIITRLQGHFAVLANVDRALVFAKSERERAFFYRRRCIDLHGQRAAEDLQIIIVKVRLCM